MYGRFLFNPLLNDKISDWSKLKAFTDDKIDVTKKWKFVSGRVENIVGKCWLPAFSHFPTMFSKGSLSGLLKVGIVWQTVKGTGYGRFRISNYAPLLRSGGVLFALVGLFVCRSVRRPHFCPEHNSKSISGIILKLHR